jgi:hypothetical protein
MAKRYRVTLTDQERESLRALTRKGKGAARTVRARRRSSWRMRGGPMRRSRRRCTAACPQSPGHASASWRRAWRRRWSTVPGAGRHAEAEPEAAGVGGRVGLHQAAGGAAALDDAVLADRYTPVHGSWLNMAELEFSMLTRQCLARRIGDRDTLAVEVAGWEAARNAQRATIRWQFTVDDARTKLHRLYPS